MTPEQNQQWQEAINPLDYLDFYALTEEGLFEAEERLRDWDVLGWAIQLRGYVITRGWKAHEPWTPNFGLRAETALIGLQTRYLTSDARVNVYRRVLLQFFHEALNPIVEWALVGDDVRRNGYQAVLRVQELCQRLLQTSGPPSAEVQLAWNQARKELLDRKGHTYLAEISTSVELAILILLEWQHIVFSQENWQSWWSQLSRVGVATLVHNLHSHHGRRLEDKGNTTSSYEPIAAAYLIALEAECPPPDWI